MIHKFISKTPIQTQETYETEMSQAHHNIYKNIIIV